MCMVAPWPTHRRQSSFVWAVFFQRASTRHIVPATQVAMSTVVSGRREGSKPAGEAGEAGGAWFVAEGR